MKPMFTALVLAACLLPARGEIQAGSQADLRDGFYLLSRDCKEESQVSMITWIKTTPPDVVRYVKRVSDLAKESMKTLDAIARQDPALRGDDDPLPPFSQAVRKSISDDKEHLLLFGSKGEIFAKRLVFTQMEACNYIVHLSKTWSERDKDKARAAKMHAMSLQWRRMRDEAFQLDDKL